ncbi:MAG: hypothetical protein D3X82_01310 [Candidatus Leucobacter sulfamidivorax]|nr:hypothetical protein [Candidatus Leucobacter sulfamidivorax]
MAHIKIDCSDSSVVLVCQTCGGAWRAFAWDRADAHDRAVAHEQRTHPGTEEAQAAREQWRRRARSGRPSLAATRR